MSASPLRYEIRVCGQLGNTMLAAFPEMNSEVAGGQTVLSGAVVDQSALYGLLSRLEALGLELIEVRRCGSPRPDDAGSPG
jgi:monoterpene epsilon-lactone hydrolase